MANEGLELRVETLPVPIEPIMTAIEAMVRPAMDTRGVRFSCDPCPPGLTVLGDHDRITQVCLNLVTNAMRATASAGHVWMSCVLDNDRVSIEVTDTGSGIPSDKLESIFAPFVQVGRKLNAPKEGPALGSPSRAGSPKPWVAH